MQLSELDRRILYEVTKLEYVQGEFERDGEEFTGWFDNSNAASDSSDSD